MSSLVRSTVLTLVVSLLLGGAWAHPRMQGQVIDESSAPLAGATVRVQGTSIRTTTDAEGRYRLLGYGVRGPLTAWLSGYYNAVSNLTSPGDQLVTITLIHHPEEDDPTYPWLSALAGNAEQTNCEACHSSEDGDLPFDGWQRDAHSGSATNPRFLSMYAGIDVDGNVSPATEYSYSRDYGTFPLPPNPANSSYGPGYKLDFPSSSGNCAACHVPVAAVDAPYGTDPLGVTGVGIEGVACDFCHKIWDVHLHPKTGLPLDNRPGVLSFEFRRPPPGHQFFAGPYDDVAPGEDTYSPLQADSSICAPCHHGVFWDTLVYDSYGEWLASPYSDPVSGKTCQDCHMPPTKTGLIALAEAGGILRQPDTTHSHQMPGASDRELLSSAVRLQVETSREDGSLDVTVVVTNQGAGHCVPTDSPLRQVILIVQATEASGKALRLLSGPTLPQWAGVGDPNRGYYAGMPGVVYAKVLMDAWTGLEPTSAYWNPTRIASDSRLAALETDSRRFSFEATPSGDPMQVSVSLVFRRAFIELMDQKGWDFPDIPMAEVKRTIP